MSCSAFVVTNAVDRLDAASNAGTFSLNPVKRFKETFIIVVICDACFKSYLSDSLGSVNKLIFQSAFTVKYIPMQEIFSGT